VPPLPLRQGQIHWVRDEAIAFPENEGREHKPTRCCIILEGAESLKQGTARVLVVPTSTRTDLKDVYDVIIPSPPAPAECVALVGHTQPILRSELTNLIQQLPAEHVQALLAAVLLVIGVAAEVANGA
jgi:mRNA-degrading endonuclease toxin of MazEF toxin-antitoxin module